MSRAMCPACGERARVIDSREHKTHCRRRYLCPQGHRYTTVEIVAPAKQGRDSYEMINAGLRMGEIIDDIGRRLRDVAKDISKLGTKP